MVVVGPSAGMAVGVTIPVAMTGPMTVVVIVPVFFAMPVLVVVFPRLAITLRVQLHVFPVPVIDVLVGRFMGTKNVTVTTYQQHHFCVRVASGNLHGGGARVAEFSPDYPALDQGIVADVVHEA